MCIAAAVGGLFQQRADSAGLGLRPHLHPSSQHPSSQQPHQQAGMERKDVMSKNVAIYKAQAAALEKGAAPGCKVVVVANPANTNALILKENAPSIPNGAAVFCLSACVCAWVCRWLLCPG